MNAFACSLALAAGLAFSGPPPSTERVETIMQDDATLLYRPRAQVRRSLKRMARLGVDRVRITARWGQVVPHREWEIRPFFDATDSSQYDAHALAKLDRAVKGARDEGMQVMLDLGFFAPRWAVTRPGRSGRDVWRPSPREFARFSRAVAERYSGGFPDPAHPARKLPAVRLWTTWNEPNHRVFLRPQWERVGGRWLPMTPHIYRRLHNVAYDQVKRVSGKNRVLIGGLASFGDRGRGPARGIGPLRFTRELACVDARLRPLRRPECRGFAPLRADGFALHPYSFHTAPGDVAPIADRVQIGELSKLTGLLARLEARGRFAQRLPLYMTEYGYQSDPPDPGGIDPALEARFSGQALELALSNPEVRSFPQFLLYDIGPDRSKPLGSRARNGGFQTGLYTYDGKPKPAVIQGFRLPFAATAIRDAEGRAGVEAFGQVRPGEGVQVVEIQRRDPNAGWVTQGCAFPTDGQGIYRRRLDYSGLGTYRARWVRSGGRFEPSAAVEVVD
ncbi:MAG: hypothetical protein ACR2J6_04755 [Thermoleophilaceae bacterium]